MLNAVNNMLNLIIYAPKIKIKISSALERYAGIQPAKTTDMNTDVWESTALANAGKPENACVYCVVVH